MGLAQTATKAPSGVEHNAKALYEQAKVSFSEGRLEVSETAFRALSGVPAFAAEGFFGLGVIRLRRGNHQAARACFEQVLKIQPAHVGARRMLATRATKPAAAPEILRAATPVIEPKPERTGVYAYALNGPAPSAQKTLSLIEQLERINVRPTFTSHIGSFLALALAAVAPLAVLMAMPRLDVALALALGAAALLSILALLWQFLVVVSTRLTLAQGRLQIREGVLRRRVSNVELWRVRNVELHRTILNQLTRDGTLVFEIQNEPPVSVLGVARGKRLDNLYQEILNLVFLLRSNPVVKGIIT